MGIARKLWDAPKTSFRTLFTDKPRQWNPWVRDGDAWEALQELTERGVPTAFRTWSGKTTYAQMADAARQAVARYQLGHERRPIELFGCQVGRMGWAVATTEREAICRAMLAHLYRVKGWL